MPVEIAPLADALRGAPGNAYVVLTQDATAVRIKSGRIARWIERHRTAANRQTIGLFAESLRSRYGRSISAQLGRSFFLDQAMEFGWPLRVRKVREIVKRGEILRVGHRMPIESSRPPTPNRGAAWPQLAHEIDMALSRGYVDRFFLSGTAECTNPMPDEAFLKVVATFNKTLEGLHRRFPRLAGVVPPNLSQNDAALSCTGVLGFYRYQTETLEFANKDSAYFDSRCQQERRISRASPRPPGLKGVITHEYSHHLSSASVCSYTYWIPRLVELLQTRGFVSSDARLNAAALSYSCFKREVGNRVREMGLGTYASTNLWEFATEALTWRMAETYGESQEIPRMPRFLEAWVHDCFPFTRDGPIPSDFVEFQPAAIKEPMMAGGLFQSVNKAPPPRPQPRPL